MAQSIFDALTGVSLDSSTVQSLLDSQSLITEVEQSAIDQDDEDIFQCGKCKCQFTSFHMFLIHKREHIKDTVDLSQYLVSNNNQVQVHIDNSHQYNPQETFIQNDQLNEPIILEETDMLFNIDQDSDNYLTQDTNFNVPIILSNDNLDNFTNSTQTISNDSNNNDDDDDDDLIKNTITTNDNDIIINNHQALQINSTQNNDDCYNLTRQDVIPIVDDNIDQHDVVDDDDINKITTTTTTTTTTVQNFKYKCNYCNKQFAKKFYWQQHERSHTGEKPYQCVVCGRAFAQKSNVKKHMSSHKVWPGTAIHSLPPDAPADGSIDRTYHCQFCKEIFDSYKTLKGHLIISHMALKVYKCVQTSCSMMFSDLDEFLEHTRNHKRSEYRCHVCAQVFNTLSDLGNHQYVHTVQKQKTTEKYYCCSICKSSFSNIEALQHHTETTTHNYVCSYCGKSFLIERFLRRHLKTHVSSARFTCEDCGKAFKTEQYLSNHKLIHSEETPFICTQCPARFKRKDRLGRHLLIHDLTKRLKCPFRGYLGCMSEFSRPDKLKRHLLTHSNIKKFSCNHCNKNFHRAQALKHHEMSKHNLKCDICSQNFKNKDQLIAHNCDQAVENKKKDNLQLSNKKNGTINKPKKTTTKRQISNKNIQTNDEDDKLIKIEDLDKRIISPDDLHLSDFDDESCEKKSLVDFSITRDINSTIEALMQSDLPGEDIKSIDFQLIQHSPNID
ncbi:hypothetical protein HCN44_002350 [Aphidius gifuensis]|uniref:C2H2-type domain-containing protein n=1 Tax=Aphidius gifuensis TaxID=684658 RepID=A0A835CU59_APHGI|nr:zinc finger protein 341-like [Aphidius gifuensis]KAF7996704.1 hypothetical protein HCN44_002350 [Aphidius gifuensis]